MVREMIEVSYRKTDGSSRLNVRLMIIDYR